MVTLSYKQLPEEITSIYKPPQRLFVAGDTSLLTAPHRLAVVGSRKVSPYGASVIEQIIPRVAKAGIVIVSGLALGVDSLAHRATLEAGGSTIAVLPSGLSAIYPTSHTLLAKKIVASGGLVISEYEPTKRPMKHHFIERNRLISACSQATLIIEASHKSGSLHTARFALEQGRDVLAIPGNITSMASEGTNRLIQAGATPITCADDILRHFGIEDAQKATPLPANPEEAAIITLLHQGISDASELLTYSKLSPAVFHSTMTMLEIEQTITPLGNNQWSLK